MSSDARIAKLWANFAGDVTCSPRCRYGYLDNDKGSEADPANCVCGRIELVTALEALATENPDER
jgi:hypothetical protein